MHKSEKQMGKCRKAQMSLKEERYNIAVKEGV